MMMRRLSKWAGVMLVMSLVLGLPFVTSVQTAGAGQFTVEFNADGTINRVFRAGITLPAGNEVQPRSDRLSGLISHLRGKTVNNITSVTIATTEDDDPCIIDGAGRLWCW